MVSTIQAEYALLMASPKPTLLSFETARFTKAPFATDVFALSVHFRGAP